MSRDIRFRVWNDDEKRLISPTELNRSMCSISLPDGTKRMIPMVTFAMVIPQSCYHLQQFTGLIDKSGREIYEGDLVNFTVRGVTHGPELEDIKAAEVYWSTEDACWVFGRYHQSAMPYPQGFMFGQSSEPYDWGYQIADRIDIKTFEVVGNIFEKVANPQAAADQSAAPVS